jgi:hypothetical protein
MCNDRSWKSCSIVTIVFTTLLMLGMFISVGVMNSMFGDNMQCYVDATNDAVYSRRQMVEGMEKIAAQHPSGDGIAAGKLALFNIAQTFGLGPAVKQLPAFRSLAPERRKLSSHMPPNDNSCVYYNLNDGMCDDYWNGACDCGTDLNDCGYRESAADCTASPPPPYQYNYNSPKSDAEKVAEVEKAVLDVFNPCMIVPAIFCALFLYIGSALTLNDPVKFSCGGKGMFITSNIFSFPSFIIYAIGTYFLLIYLNIILEIIRKAFENAAGTDDHLFTKCLDDTRAMLTSAVVGCLFSCIGCLGAFISAICASCGICKHETKLKAAPAVPGVQMSDIPIATPVPV